MEKDIDLAYELVEGCQKYSRQEFLDFRGEGSPIFLHHDCPYWESRYSPLSGQLCRNCKFWTLELKKREGVESKPFVREVEEGVPPFTPVLGEIVQTACPECGSEWGLYYGVACCHCGKIFEGGYARGQRCKNAFTKNCGSACPYFGTDKCRGGVICTHVFD